MIKILFLAANPPGTARLDLDREVNKIEEGLQRSKLRDQFQIVTKWAVDSNALRRALLEENPDIVHFSGHGEGQAGLVLVGQDGQPKPATDEALSGLFKHFPNIKCVLLNACYAEMQAKAIVEHVNYVVGMKQAVRDDAAIAFATGFYDALGYGKSISTAFELGCNAIQFELASFSAAMRSRKLIPVTLENTESLADHLVPVLLKKKTDSTQQVTSALFPPKPNISPNPLQNQDSLPKADAVTIYRERVQAYLSDLKLTQIERFQLAILAHVLGLSEADANRILQEEQDKRNKNSQPTATSRSGLQSRTKKYGLACAAIVAIVGGSFFAYKQITNPYAQLQNLLQKKEWKAADEETARILRETAGKKTEETLGVKDFRELSCSQLNNINTLWEKYSNKYFGFGVQKQIWMSSEVNSNFQQFGLRVGWMRHYNGSIVYMHKDLQRFNLDAPVGLLPWATTYYGGNEETRRAYLVKLVECFP